MLSTRRAFRNPATCFGHDTTSYQRFHERLADLAPQAAQSTQ